METRLLHYFVTVARERQFTRAAAKLNISQSALSQQIQALETQLGVTLFDRSARRVELTDEGQFLYEKTVPLLAQLKEIEAALTDREQVLGKQLHIAAVPSAASLFLPAVLARLQQMIPALEIHLKECSSRLALELLGDHEVHAAIIRPPFDLQGLALHEISREPIVAIVSPEHPLARAQSIALGQLADEPFILFDARQANALASKIWAACLEAGFVPRVLCEGPELLTMANLVSAGLGVALMPREMTRLIPPEKVAVLSLHAPKTASSLALVWDQTGYLPQTAQFFIRLMQETSTLEA